MASDGRAAVGAARGGGGGVAAEGGGGGAAGPGCCWKAWPIMLPIATPAPRPAPAPARPPGFAAAILIESAACIWAYWLRCPPRTPSFDQRTKLGVLGEGD